MLLMKILKIKFNQKHCQNNKKSWNIPKWKKAQYLDKVEVTTTVFSFQCLPYKEELKSKLP